jgi:hypothetical protein
MTRRGSGGNNDGDLPEIKVTFSSECFLKSLLAGLTAVEAVRNARAESGVGYVLACDNPHTYPQVDVARDDSGRRRAYHHAIRSCFHVSGYERKRQYSAPQEPGWSRTAVASISTSHSGRAKASTTRPVETGYTPLRYVPMVL